MAKDDIEKIIKKVQSDSHKKMEKLFKLHREYNDDKFKVVDEKFKSIDQKLDGNTKILNSHSEQIANLTMDMMEVKRDIKDIKFEVQLVLDKKVDKKHFVDLEGRVRVLEKK